MTPHTPYRSCPVCNSTSVTDIKKIEFMLFVKHPMADGYTVVQCNECGFVYADTKVTQDDLDIYYREVSKYEDKTIGTGGGFTQYDKDRLIKTAEFIAAQTQDRSIRIADIGCANGGLLKELKNLGFTNLVGIDPSLACIEISRTEVGCAAYQYSIFDISPEVGKFDLIILSHVLEHILELRSTVNMLNKLLVDGGSVYAECPDAGNYSKVIHAPYQELNTEHINHFTDTSFMNLFGSYGYDKRYTGTKTMKIASGDDYYAVYGIFKKTNKPGYTVQYDSAILEKVTDYIHISDDIYNDIISEIKQIPDPITIALFGIGQFAFKLLADPVFEGKNIILFDNNNINIGRSINGRTIYNGADVANVLGKDDVIVITSLIHEHEIRKGIINIFERDLIPVPQIRGFKKLLNDHINN